jgi:hypothetical protein
MKREDQKTVTVGAQSFDAMWAEFASNTAEQTQPEGSITAQQFAERFGCTVKQAAARMEKLRSELVRMRVGGQIRSVRCYFLK